MRVGFDCRMKVRESESKLCSAVVESGVAANHHHCHYECRHCCFDDDFYYFASSSRFLFARNPGFLDFAQRAAAKNTQTSLLVPPAPLLLKYHSAGRKPRMV